MYIHWDKSYETGHPLIDAEHRLLVMLFRKLDVAIKTHQPDATTARIVVEVRKFVEFHFASEENLMSETNFPGFAAHVAAHSELMTEAQLMMSKLATHREYPDDVLTFLNRWLIEHIAHHDQEVARHVRGSFRRPVAESCYSEYLLTTPPDPPPG
jgi:hemerythrin-like metal-binding protein